VTAGAKAMPEFANDNTGASVYQDEWRSYNLTGCIHTRQTQLSSHGSESKKDDK